MLTFISTDKEQNVIAIALKSFYLQLTCLRRYKTMPDKKIDHNRTTGSLELWWEHFLKSIL